MRTWKRRLLLLPASLLPLVGLAQTGTESAASSAQTLGDLMVTLTVVLGAFTVLLTFVILLLIIGVKNGRLKINF